MKRKHKKNKYNLKTDIMDGEWWRALIKNSINDFQNIKLKV